MKPVAALAALIVLGFVHFLTLAILLMCSGFGSGTVRFMLGFVLRHGSAPLPPAGSEATASPPRQRQRRTIPPAGKGSR